MQRNTLRTLMLVAFLINLVFLTFIILDYIHWSSTWIVPLFVAWGVFILIAILLGLFLRADDEPRRETPVEFVAVPATPAPTGPFVYNGYTLFSREMQLKGDSKQRTIYFFSKRKPKSGVAIPKPAGFHVGVNEKTGLPFLKRGVGNEGEDLTPVFEPQPHPQCAAITEDGKQCRNSSRAESKYCASHFGYQPHEAKTIRKETGHGVAEADTRPRWLRSKDTKPATRRQAEAS
jgi:hypothetical protein